MEWYGFHTQAPARNTFSEGLKLIKENLANNIVYANVRSKYKKAPEYMPVDELDSPLSSEEAVAKLCGHDNSGGSCYSLALAYAANRNGMDVTDYRGGSSREILSYTFAALRLKANGDGKDIRNITPKDIGMKCHSNCYASDVLKMLPPNKETIMIFGGHAAVVRKKNDGSAEYLELQASSHASDYQKKYGYFSGWHSWNASHNTEGTDVNGSTFKYWEEGAMARFGKGAQGRQNVFTIDVDSCNTDGFRDLMGYINTDSAKQKKDKSYKAGGKV